MSTQQQIQENEAKEGAMMFGSGVYIAGVIAATMLFITFVLTAFPKDAYFSRFIMTGAGLAVGASMLAFPNALHNWVFERKHRKITVTLYYIEMAFIAVNTVVSFVVLLSKATSFDAPAWAVLYEPFSILSIVYVIFAWGTIKITDPKAKTKQLEKEYQETFDLRVAQKQIMFLEGAEGEAAIASAALQKINKHGEEKQTSSLFSGRSVHINEATTVSPNVKEQRIKEAGTPPTSFQD